MAANPTVHGEAFVFGITGSVTGAEIQSFQVKKEPQNNAQVMDSLGNEIANRHDDVVEEGTVALKFKTSGFTEADPEDVITIDSKKYRATSVDLNETNGDYSEITYSIRTSEHITLV